MGLSDSSLAAALDRLSLWPARLAWFVTPILVLPGFADSTGPAGIGVWLAWFVGFVSLLAPSTVSLTIVRIIGPAFSAMLIVSALFNSWSGSVLASLACTFLLNLILFLPTTGDPMVNGSSYGPERRFALRPPAAALVGTAQIAWAITVAGVVTGPLLIAYGYVLAGIPATLVGLFLAWRTGKSLHQLARRWVVFVPAGFVLHDHWSMADSMLVRRSQNPMLGPAPAGVDTKPGVVDISAGALGLALAVEFTEPIPFALRRGRDIITESATLAVFTPSLPGKVLTEARARAIPIG